MKTKQILSFLLITFFLSISPVIIFDMEKLPSITHATSNSSISVTCPKGDCQIGTFPGMPIIVKGCSETVGYLMVKAYGKYVGQIAIEDTKLGHEAQWFCSQT